MVVDAAPGHFRERRHDHVQAGPVPAAGQVAVCLMAQQPLEARRGMGNLGAAPNPPSLGDRTALRAAPWRVRSKRLVVKPFALIAGQVELAHRLHQPAALLLEVAAPVGEHLANAQQQVGEAR